jgi:hypothetical protein
MTDKKEGITFQRSSETKELANLIDLHNVVDHLYQKGVINLPNSDQNVYKQLSMLSTAAMKIVENGEKKFSMRRRATRTVVGAAIYIASKKLGITTTYRELGQALGLTPTAIINLARQLNKA